jgi:tetratricopeptide (TPR) repeat protein
MFIIPLLAVLVLVLLISFGFYLYTSRSTLGGGKKKTSNKPPEVLLMEANKKLAKEPRNIEALAEAAGIYYHMQDWESAYRNYEMLADMPESADTVDQYDVNYRAATSAYKLKMYDAAYRFFVVARSMNPNDFEVNYQLGELLFSQENWEKSVLFYQSAYRINPEHAPTLRGIGHSYFKLKRYKDAMTYIRKAMEIAPDDKESLFTLAECYEEAEQNDQALRIYGHLRPDPVWGAEACLRAGLLNTATHQDKQAIEDFEIGLKHEKIKQETKLELHYQLGLAYLQQKEIEKTMENLSIVASFDSNYKGTAALITKYAELHRNKNLQIYLLSSMAEFIALCRKIVLAYYQRAQVKITKTTMEANDWADVIAEVNTAKWSDIVMFRFIRTQGNIGEFVVRDFQAHIKDVKAGKGICMSIGRYSDEARRFTQARLIDLVEKDQLQNILSSLDTLLQKTN